MFAHMREKSPTFFIGQLIIFHDIISLERIIDCRFSLQCHHAALVEHVCVVACVVRWGIFNSPKEKSRMLTKIVFPLRLFPPSLSLRTSPQHTERERSAEQCEIWNWNFARCKNRTSPLNYIFLSVCRLSFVCWIQVKLEILSESVDTFKVSQHWKNSTEKKIVIISIDLKGGDWAILNMLDKHDDFYWRDQKKYSLFLECKKLFTSFFFGFSRFSFSRWNFLCKFWSLLQLDDRNIEWSCRIAQACSRRLLVEIKIVFIQLLSFLCKLSNLLATRPSLTLSYFFANTQKCAVVHEQEYSNFSMRISDPNFKNALRLNVTNYIDRWQDDKRLSSSTCTEARRKILFTFLAFTLNSSMNFPPSR